MLIEAGLGLTKLRRAMAAEDCAFERLSAILISHEHRDHCAVARELAQTYHVPILANEQVLRAASLADLPEAHVLAVGSPTLIGDVQVNSFPVSHDAVSPVGFCLQHQARTITIATDLGRETQEVIEAVSRGDLVVLEANHDTEMLHQGRYPLHLRRRVSGPRGHLSNTQAASILTRHIKSEDTEVWLAHLSRENNSVALALKSVTRTLKAAGLGAVAVDVALRDKPSLRWNGAPRVRQLSLFGSS